MRSALLPVLVASACDGSSDGHSLRATSMAMAHSSSLPWDGRGAMPVPTIADVDGDGDLDVVVSLKEAVDRMRSVLVFESRARRRIA